MSAQIRCKWVGGLQFIGSDAERHSVVMDASAEGGKGEGLGFRPAQMLLLGLGACTGMDVISVLEKQRQKVTGFEVNVQGQQESEPPWPFRSMRVEYVIKGRDIQRPAVERAIDLSESKYCSVWATLRAQVDIISSYRIEEEASSASE